MSSSDNINKSRRRFLTLTTATIGGAGAITAAIPFIKAFKPSAKAVAAGAPVEADISNLMPGQKLEIAWRGKPVFIIRRTKEVLESLSSLNNELKDPDSNESEQPEYAKNPNRSLQDEYLVLVAICTHLGCVPKLYAKDKKPTENREKWFGGFYCPCHSSTFDLAGRVFSDAPAAANLTVPPYAFIDNDKRIIIGLNPDEIAA